MANIFTSLAETLARNLWNGTGTAPATYYIGWGTGAGTSAKGDTSLFTEANESRVAASRGLPGPNQNSLTATIFAQGAKTITNAGAFTASSGGELHLKTDFAGVVLDAGDAIQFTFTQTWG
jgi:hypothetical protein